MIKQLDRTSLKLLRTDLDAALTAIAQKHGIILTVGNARFTSSTATFKLNVATKAADGTIINREREDFISLADVYGLKPEWIDKTFQWSGNTYKITGLQPRRRKNPVLVRNRNGKGYVFGVDTIKMLMGAGASVLPISRNSVVIGRGNPNHTEIESLIVDLRNNNPEGYYADGEHRAAGMSEKQIHDMHYRRFAQDFGNKS